MSVDYAAVRADLASRQAAIGQILEGFDRLLGTGGGMPETGRSAVAALPAPAKTARAKPARKVAAARAPHAVTARRSKGDPAEMARARTITGRDGLRAASTATGIKYQTLWQRARKEGWKVAPSPRGRAVAQREVTVVARRPPTATPVAEPPKPPTPQGAVLRELRVCEKCHQKTIFDPCQHCHTPWDRSRRVA